MKYLSSRFEDYILECDSSNLHNELEEINNTLSKKLKNQHNIIYYGPPGTGKYTQALYYMRQFSPTLLKYERKIIISTNNKKSYQFKVSDIHFEIDIQLLGCNAKVLFNEIYNNIIDIVSSRKTLLTRIPSGMTSKIFAFAITILLRAKRIRSLVLLLKRLKQYRLVLFMKRLMLTMMATPLRRLPSL